MSPDSRRLVTLAEAAEYSSLTERTLRRRIAAGQLRAHRLGSRIIRLRLSDVDAMFEQIGGDAA